MCWVINYCYSTFLQFEEWWTSVLPCVAAKIEQSFEGIKSKAISKEKSMWTGFSYTVDEFTSGKIVRL